MIPIGKCVFQCAHADPTIAHWLQVSIIIEFIAGSVTGSIDRLIALYRPDSLVVGTRGQRGIMQAWGAALGGSSVGSVSKCVYATLHAEGHATDHAFSSDIA